MNSLKEFAVRAYVGGLTAAPFIGANYNVWENYDPRYKYTVREFATDAISGAFAGAVFGILSPVMALGMPAYVFSKVVFKPQK
jgi:hypothetical protein